MTDDLDSLFESQQDEALRRRLQPPPKFDRSPSAEYRSMRRLLSNDDCRFLRSQGASRLLIARFRIGRARLMHKVASSLSIRVREGLLELVARGEEADKVASDRISLALSIARLNLLAAAFAIGFDVEKTAKKRVTETLRRHLSAEILSFPQSPR